LVEVTLWVSVGVCVDVDVRVAEWVEVTLRVAVRV
jgi:hypothetical protein